MAKTPASQFYNAVDTFFGFNPANPFWALVALAMRKDGCLKIMNNLSDEECVLLDDGTSAYSEEQDLHIVCYPSNPKMVKDIIRVFDKNKRNNSRENVFPPIQWERIILLEFVESIISIDESWIQSSFTDSFDYILQRCNAKKQLAIYTQPKELTELIGHLIGDDVNNVYNPFAGIGSYTSILQPYMTYKGEEMVELIAAIGNLRMLETSDIMGYISTQDSVHNEIFNADIILATPPFNKPVNANLANNSGENWFRNGDAVTFLLQKCATNNVKGIIVAPISLNYKSGYSFDLRKNLLEKGCVDMIISLPANLFEGTAIATAVYVLNPDHGHKGSIRFINASKLFVSERRKNILDVPAIVDLISNGGVQSKLVSYEDIYSNLCTFSPEAYLSQNIQAPTGSKVLSMTELGRFQRRKREGRLNCVKYADVNKFTSPNLAKIYNYGDFTSINLSKPYIVIDSAGILISGKDGITGYCIDPGKDILYANWNYNFFVVDSNIILPQYLAIQFSQEYVRDQLGITSLISVPQNVLERLRIIVPSLEEQRRVVDEYLSQLVSKLGVEIDFLKMQKAQEFERNMSLRKHALKQVLNEIVPGARRISKFVSDSSCDFSKRTVIAQRSQSTLEDYTVKLYSNIIKVQNLISSLTDDRSYAPGDSLGIVAFLENYVANKFAENFTLDLIRVFSEENFDGEFIDAPSELYVSIADTELTTALDNIISNAQKYGFTDERRCDYSVLISCGPVIIDGVSWLQISVKNNGSKLPGGMTPDRMFKWGVGSGTGLGTWHTKNIIEHFGGTVGFVQDETASDGYIIEYKLLLPLN